MVSSQRGYFELKENNAPTFHTQIFTSWCWWKADVGFFCLHCIAFTCYYLLHHTEML